MALSINLLPCAGNSPASIHSLHAGHDTRVVFGDGQITLRQLLQGPDSVLAVIDGPQQVRAQQFSQLPGIDSVTFAALFQIVIATWITHHKLRDMRLQQVIQPAAQVPSSNVRYRLPRSPCTNSRIVIALVSMMLSITSLPEEFRTAIEIASL